MNSNSVVKTEIEKIRKTLYSVLEDEPVCSEKALLLSRQLDVLILQLILEDEVLEVC
jgi:hypothetical protein